MEETEMNVPRANRLIKQALERLKEHHPQLSLRSVAARLQITPSYLSKIVNGHKRVPETLVPSLGRVLHLDQHQLEELQLAILEDIESTRLTGQTGIRTLNHGKKSRTSDYENFGRNDFWLLEKWYYIPLLNLVTTKDFCEDPQWVASRMGLTEDVVRRALDDLLRAGFLSREDGRLKRAILKFRFPTSASHGVIREYHRKLLNKAERKLNTEVSDEDFAGRLISGVCFAGSSQAMAQARVVLSDALYKIAELMAEGECDEVYHLGAQLFRVTKSV